ncbi:unnamed protein product [Peniophora sp. CBMAI 1063]|nr:unnamed protein product [Peniophora sp. CBMAI 1063]
MNKFYPLPPNAGHPHGAHVPTPSSYYPAHANIIPPPAAAPRGGYHHHDYVSSASQQLTAPPRSMVADSGRGHYPVNKKTARILADEPRQHGPRSGDPVPGTPHWKAGALPREGAVPLNTRHTSNHEGAHHSTSHAGREGTAPPRRLDSPLYKREPRPIHIDMPFMHFNASGMEVPGLDPEYPGSSIKNGDSMVFAGELGTLVYVFQAEGYAPITREINLNHGHGYHLQTLAGIACDLIRGFYRNHAELGVDSARVVPMGLIYPKKPGDGYVVVAGLAQ